MLDLLVWGFWLVFGVYGSWFLFWARTVQFLTLDDLALTWRVHKRLTGCKASRVHCLITNNDEVVGFQCACGYQFIQKRLITQKTHKYPGFRQSPLIPSKRKPLPITKSSS